MRIKFTFLSALFLLFVGQVIFAQVTGTVQDGDGFPVSDAEVIVRGGDAMAITNENGTFSIDAQIGDVLIVTDLIMGTSKEFNVNRNKLGILKLGEALVLNEVTLVGGVKLDISQKVGANTVVGKEDFELAPIATIDEVLNGRVAGLSFSANSGHPGGTNIITIRGVGSFVGTPNPLYVIDGVVIGKGQDAASVLESYNPLTSIDPNSIESVAVLKDASATALYGARGANGVIVVTTKRGKYNQKTRFNLSSDFGIQDIAYDKQDWMTADEFVQWGGLTLYNQPNYAGTREDAVNEFITGSGWDGVTNTDWLDVVTRGNSSVKTYNFSATGGGENTSFRAGGAYTENRPLLINSKFDRFSTNLAADHKVTDKFVLGTNVNFTHVATTGVDDGGAFRNPFLTQWTISPIFPVYDDQGELNQILGGQSDYNPVGLQQTDFQKANIKTFVGSINGELQFFENFYFYSLFGAQYQVIDETSFWSKEHGDGANYGGQVTKANTQTFDWNWSSSISYRNLINEKHDLQIYLGSEYQEHTYHNLYLQAWHLVRDEPWISFGSVDQGEILPSYDEFRKWIQFSYYGKLNYIFDRKYTLSATVRNDNNSTLGDKKSGWFWSVGAGWDIAKENFMPSFLDKLNLRASYGEIGNVPYADSWGSINNQFTMAELISYGSDSGLGIGTIGNPALIWESVNQLNLGLDFSLANNVFGASIDVYNKETVDAIYRANIAQTSGGGDSQRNIGNIKNKGIEVSFDLRPFNKEFKWVVNGNFSYNKNTVGDMLDPEEIQTNSRRGIKEGQLFAEYYTRGWAGVDAETGRALFWTDETETETTIDFDAAAPYFQGITPFPTYMAGLQSQFIYKGFSLSIFFTGQFDYAVQNRWQNYVTNDGQYALSYYNQTSDVLYDSWIKGEDNSGVTNPIQIVGNSTLSNSSSSRWLRDGDHVRLKEAKLAYSFGDVFRKATGVDNLTLYVKGTNLMIWVFDDELTFDPESNTNAFGGGWAGKGLFDYTAPIMRTISLGVSIDF